LNIFDIDETATVPRCFAAEKTNDIYQSIVIVLEDKKVQGYEVLDLKKGLNVEQCCSVLKRAALLHSTSMALHHLEPQTADMLRRTFDKEYSVDTFRDGLNDLKLSYLDGLGKLTAIK